MTLLITITGICVCFSAGTFFGAALGGRKLKQALDELAGTENLLRDEIDKREAALTERNLANARAQLLREQLADVTPVRAPNGQFVSRAA